MQFIIYVQFLRSVAHVVQVFVDWEHGVTPHPAGGREGGVETCNGVPWGVPQQTIPAFCCNSYMPHFHALTFLCMDTGLRIEARAGEC